MADQIPHPDPDQIDAPEALIRDLAGLRGRGPRIEIPAEITARIRAEARACLARRNRHAWVFRVAMTGAAAALVAFAFLITTWNSNRRGSSPLAQDAYNPPILQAL